MKKLISTFFTLTLLGFLNLNAQIIVEVGDDLLAIIEGADDGSEIIIKSGSHKAAYNTINIVEKSLTIKGEEGAPKPKVYIKSFSVSSLPETEISLTLEGIEFSGATYDSLIGIEDTVTLRGEYLINLTSDFESGNDIILRDCIVRNFQKSVIRGDRAENHVNNILVDDCIIFDLRGGSSYGPFRLKSNITFDDFTIQNSTFHHIQGPLIDCKDMISYPAVVEVNHCTFYKWGGIITNKYLFDFASNGQASVSILNSILAKTNNDNDDEIYVWGFRLGVVAYKEMSFCVMTPDFSLDDSTYAMVEWNTSDFTYEDYEVDFLYPDTSNFSIPYPDDLYEMSDEGTLIGDPRWSLAPNAVEDIFNTNQFTVCPVPARDEVYLMNGGNGIVEVFNPLGVKVDEIQLNNDAIYSLDISGYESGIYILRMNNNNVRRIIVE